MKPIFLGAGALAASFFGFLAGLHVHFPSAAALERLRYEVQDRSNGDWGLDASDLSLYRLTGVTLDDATLYKVKKSRFRRRGDDEKPPEVTAFLALERLSARLELLPLLRGGTMVDFDADLYGGNLSGAAGQVGSSMRFQADGEDIDLSKMPLSGDDWNANLTGMLKIDADLDINREQSKESKGHLSISAEDLALVSGEFSGFKLDPMKFTESVLSFEVDNGVAKVKEGHLVSDMLEATISGDVTLNKDFKRWRMRLSVVVTLNEALDKLARFAPGLSEARADDGSYHFMMAGTPGLARLRPDRLGARGGTGGPMGGPRDGGGDDEEGPAPMMDDPGVEPGNDMSAEERRQARLERIRKARERRKARQAERGIDPESEDGGDLPMRGPGRLPPLQRGGPFMPGQQMDQPGDMGDRPGRQGNDEDQQPGDFDPNQDQGGEDDQGQGPDEPFDPNQEN